ncbi:MAG: type IV pilin protein [Nodosilinea sp.]
MINRRHHDPAPHALSAQGFTLIELLITLAMVGILAALVLPFFLKQVDRARQVKAISVIGALNQAQHSFYSENARFADSIVELGFSHLSGEETYTYTVQPATASGPNSLPGRRFKVASVVAQPTDSTLQGYTGLVYTHQDGAGQVVLSSVVCQGDDSTTPTPELIADSTNQVEVRGCNSTLRTMATEQAACDSEPRAQPAPTDDLEQPQQSADCPEL